MMHFYLRGPIIYYCPILSQHEFVIALSLHPQALHSVLKMLQQDFAFVPA